MKLGKDFYRAMSVRFKVDSDAVFERFSVQVLDTCWCTRNRHFLKV